MDLFIIFIVTFIVITMINDIETVLLKKTDLKSLSLKVLFVSEEESLLQCARRCKYRDKKTIINFKDTKCECISNEDDTEDKDRRTLSGLFETHPIMKMEKPETPLINVALNKFAYQSSTYYDDPMNAAKLAVDGDLSTKSIAQSKINQWWAVDLKKVFHVKHMVLKGKASAKHNRELMVQTRQRQDDPWVNCKELGNLYTSPLDFKCAEKTLAGYVRISSTKRCYIFIKVFEVYAPVTV